MSAVDVAPRRRWLAYALTTVALWGVWGALAGLSAQRGFPDTLVYCVWALTMVPPALFILWRTGWQLDRSPRAVAYGLAIGLLGAIQRVTQQHRGRQDRRERVRDALARDVRRRTVRWLVQPLVVLVERNKKIRNLAE